MAPLFDRDHGEPARGHPGGAGRLRIGQRPPGAGPGRRLAPFTRARDLEAAVCLLGLARYPGRYREAAGAWLARMLASAGPAV